MYDVALCMNADSNTDTGHLTLLFIYTPRLLQTVVFIARERENFAVLDFILPGLYCTDGYIYHKRESGKTLLFLVLYSQLAQTIARKRNTFLNCTH